MKGLYICCGLLMSVIQGFSQDTIRIVSNAPSYYVTMKHGKLIEFNQGRHRTIIKDLVLTDGTTIHPDGSVDLGSGQSHKLTHSEYMTMDGRISKMKNMGKITDSKWKPDR